MKISTCFITRFMASTAMALTLTGVLYAGGTAAGQAAIELQKNYRIELFNRAMEEQDLVARMITDPDIRSMTAHYVGALADAVVHFEFFPRTDDAKIFLEIVSVLPSHLNIGRFEFMRRNISMDCTAYDEESLTQFSHALKGLSFFQDVSLESYQKNDGTYIGTIICIAA